ncbi:hypothetical protein FB45DRAFT_1011343 [Roridomyces roridus]|uniref:Uncharacterized protein n=1 Tax=Roridomyces roridus TaxID=1738132 RepID=A0AAD7B1M5_9AGAR|nr:hypothetical protein FB45DRAFT_1011343 [Roridomyces roridus]
MLGPFTVLLAFSRRCLGRLLFIISGPLDADQQPVYPLGHLLLVQQLPWHSSTPDSSLTGCTSAFINATSAFAPSSSSQTQSKSTITSTLDTICSSSITDACPQSLLTGKLADFKTACNTELVTSPNTQVKTLYDTFYGLIPLKAVVCTKDDSGNYCALQANSTSLAGATVAEGVASVASSIRRGVTTTYLPDSQGIANTNAMFLGQFASANKDELCVPCVRAVLTSWLTFESGTNYAPGLAQSVLIPGQSALYSGVVSTCGADFLQNVAQAAGGSTAGPAGALGGAGGAGSAGSGAVSVRAGALVATLVGAVIAVFML